MSTQGKKCRLTLNQAAPAQDCERCGQNTGSFFWSCGGNAFCPNCVSTKDALEKNVAKPNCPVHGKSPLGKEPEIRGSMFKPQGSRTDGDSEVLKVAIHGILRDHPDPDKAMVRLIRAREQRVREEALDEAAKMLRKKSTEEDDKGSYNHQYAEGIAQASYEVEALKEKGDDSE